MHSDNATTRINGGKVSSSMNESQSETTIRMPFEIGTQFAQALKDFQQHKDEDSQNTQNSRSRRRDKKKNSSKQPVVDKY